jgi:hypothetical protein
MKRIATGLICISFFLWAAECSAAYLIHLKDGRNITTHEYWEEGDQIKIKQYGGIVGIGKEEVLSIDKIDESKTIIKKSPTKPLEKEPPPKTEEAKTFVTENGSQKQKEVSKSRKGNEKNHPNEILNEFDNLRAKFKTIESMSREEITQFDKALDSLRNKMLKADIGGSYTDHLFAIQSMGDKAKEVLKKRGQ